MSGAEGLTVIGASAGTGKTYRLTGLVWDACRPRVPGEGGAPLPPEQLVAVTFTEKAAGELAERIRTKLFAEHAADAALRLSLAYLGTVHAVGLRLIGEHAFDAGQPPELGVLPDDGGLLLRTLLEQAVPRERQERIEALVRRLEIAWDGKLWRSRWQEEVFKIVDVARANRIPPAEVRAMAARSWSTMREYLPTAFDATRDLEADLRTAAQRLFDTGLGDDKTKGSAKALAELREALRKIDESGAWRWWLKVAHLDPCLPSETLFQPVKDLAALHTADPHFHADIEGYLTEAFGAAADVLETFAAWKAERRVLDWKDMLDLALHVLDTPEIAADLRTRLGLVVVDELQDSEPLQLATFARLHEVVGKSVWVGDPKQCIFEWNGADPALMDALLAEVAQTGGATDRLHTNYRSRAALVEGCSALFASAFATVGMAAADVEVAPCSVRQVDAPGLAGLAPLGIAFIDDAQGSAAAQFAERVAGMLAAPEETPVLDRRTQIVRPVASEDIAVLFATNAECEDVAVELRRRGIPATAATNGLLATREGRAVMAALRLLIAGDESLAEAELEALAGFTAFGDESAVPAEPADPDRAREAWLTSVLDARATPREEGAERVRGRWTVMLDGVRRDLSALSPSAALDRAIGASDLPRAALGWGAPEGGAQRVANLDALRRMARAYEAEASGGAVAGTLSGLMRYLTAAAEAPRRDAQHVSDGGGEGHGAVVVTTYHRAKGLEWPVVILGSLDRAPRRTPFEVSPESSTPPSLAAPLAGRWIRYWPWPYGAMGTGALLESITAGAVGVEVAERERRERIRLLYVGFTRARDHLVLGIPRSKKGEWRTSWLDVLGDGATTFWELPPTGTGTARFRGPRATVALPCRELAPDPRTFTQAMAQVFKRPREEVIRTARRMAPSRIEATELAGIGGCSLRVGEIVTLGEPLFGRVRGGEAIAERVGLAVHGFLAMDADASRNVDPNARSRRLQSWLAGYDLVGAIEPEAVLGSADRFWAWVASRWPEARLRPEVAIQARVGARDQLRILGGTIDLLVETADRSIIVDHKTSGANIDPTKTALGYAPQLAAYRVAVASASTTAAPIATWVHFPMAGLAVELR